MNFLISNVNIISKEEFIRYREEALNLAKHPEDAPFIALALSRKLAIWSDDKGLKEQSVVKIFSTNELVSLLEIY